MIDNVLVFYYSGNIKGGKHRVVPPPPSHGEITMATEKIYLGRIKKTSRILPLQTKIFILINILGIVGGIGDLGILATGTFIVILTDTCFINGKLPKFSLIHYIHKRVGTQSKTFSNRRMLLKNAPRFTVWGDILQVINQYPPL